MNKNKLQCVFLSFLDRVLLIYYNDISPRNVTTLYNNVTNICHSFLSRNLPHVGILSRNLRRPKIALAKNMITICQLEKSHHEKPILRTSVIHVSRNLVFLTISNNSIVTTLTTDGIFLLFCFCTNFFNFILTYIRLFLDIICH